VRSGVYRAQTQIRSQNLPNHLWLKPHVRLRPSDLNVATRACYRLQRAERLVELSQDLFGEAGPDLAYCLEVFGIGIVTSEKESAVDVCPFALSMVRTDNDQIERVANAGKIVLLQLEYCETTSVIQVVSLPSANSYSVCLVHRLTMLL